MVGASGSGKSVTARAIAAHLLDRQRAEGERERLVVFDALNEWRPVGRTVARSRLEMLQALRAERFPVVVAATFEDFSPLDEMRSLVVVVDEAHRYATPAAIHASQRRLVCEGRHYGTSTVFVTQRPSHLNPDVIGNASTVWIHPLQHQADRAAVERGLGINLASRSWEPVATPDGPHISARKPLRWPRDFS